MGILAVSLGRGRPEFTCLISQHGLQNLCEEHVVLVRLTAQAQEVHNQLSRAVTSGKLAPSLLQRSEGIIKNLEAETLGCNCKPRFNLRIWHCSGKFQSQVSLTWGLVLSLGLPLPLAKGVQANEARLHQER